jgi:hypothetical protein
MNNYKKIDFEAFLKPTYKHYSGNYSFKFLYKLYLKLLLPKYHTNRHCTLRTV